MLQRDVPAAEPSVQPTLRQTARRRIRHELERLSVPGEGNDDGDQDVSRWVILHYGRRLPEVHPGHLVVLTELAYRLVFLSDCFHGKPGRCGA